MTPKQFRVEFRTGKSIFVSMQGANNIAQLVCFLPRELRQCQSGKLLCALNESAVPVYAGLFDADETQAVYIQNGVLYITVWKELTLGQSLQIQVFGSLPNGQVFPTPVSETLLFDKSIVYDPLVNAPPNIIDDLIAKAHTHPNKLILDLLTDTGGELFYDGAALATAAALLAEANTREGEDSDIRDDVAPLTNLELEALINQALIAVQN
jgi:hypothetical protein